MQVAGDAFAVLQDRQQLPLVLGAGPFQGERRLAGEGGQQAHVVGVTETRAARRAGPPPAGPAPVPTGQRRRPAPGRWASGPATRRDTQIGYHDRGRVADHLPENASPPCVPALRAGAWRRGRRPRPPVRRRCRRRAGQDDDLCRAGDLAGPAGHQLQGGGPVDLAEQHGGDLGGGLQPALPSIRGGVEAGVVDGHAGGHRQRHHRLLVVGGELGGGALLGEVEVAEDVVADTDRHAEEAAHRRVVFGKAGREGVFGDVAQPDRLGFVDQQAENAAPGGQVADAPVFGDGQSVGDELDQPPVGTDHAQRAVACAGQPAGGHHDALQGTAQVQAGADADDRLQQSGEALPAGHHVADPQLQFGQQLVQAYPGQCGQAQRRARSRTSGPGSRSGVSVTSRM